MGVPVDTDLATWLEASVEHVQRAKRAKRLGGKKMSESTAIVVQRDVSGPLEFTPQQQMMIRDTYANGADTKEFQVLMEIAKVRRLNPLLRQVHFVKRWDSQKQKEIWSVQVSVDGLRAIAERTGKYDGQDEPEYELDPEGHVISCKVKVYRKDWSRPAVGVAYWSEYVQTKKDGSPTRFWVSMPRVMIAKCAEAIAMRKAFPEDMGGLYVDEEMQQAENDRATGEPPRITGHGSPDANPKWVDPVVYQRAIAMLTECDKAVFDPACSWETMNFWRQQLGRKVEPSVKGKELSEIYRGDISNEERAGLSKLWHRVARKLDQLEGRLKGPSVEASFTDEPDGTEALAPEREPGDDSDEL